MNIFIIYIFSFSIILSQTGIDYLKQYPFDKLNYDMNTDDITFKNFYEGYINGYIRGNEMTRNISYSFLSKKIGSKDYNIKVDLSTRLIGFDMNEYISIVKRWCIANPQKTHLPFDQILFLSFVELPFKE